MVEFHARHFVPYENSSEPPTVGIGWNLFHRGAVFKNLGRRPEGRSTHWFQTTKYLQAGYVDGWVRTPNEAARTSLAYYELKPGAKIHLGIRGRHCIDSLVIRSVEVEDLPRLDSIREAFERIPKDRQKGDVILSELKSPHRGKQVTVRFIQGAPFDLDHLEGTP